MEFICLLNIQEFIAYRSQHKTKHRSVNKQASPAFKRYLTKVVVNSKNLNKEKQNG